MKNIKYLTRKIIGIISISIGMSNAVFALGFRVTALNTYQQADQLIEEQGTGSTTITIEAVDGFGAVDTSYTGNAWINAKSGAAILNDAAVHVDPTFNPVFPILNAPSNQITLNSGVWSGKLLISKEKVSVQLYIHDASGNEGYSNLFDIAAGGFNSLWFKMPDETYTPGYYPGNTGTPRTYTAGTTIQIADNCKLYAIDNSWNNVSLGLAAADLRITSLDGVIEVLTPLTIPNFGEASIYDVRLRSAHTTIPMQLKAEITSGAHMGKSGISNPFIVLPGAYNRVIVCLPEQELIPGGEYRDDNGDSTYAWEPKTFGDPIDQRVNRPFEVTVHLTDNCFNQVQMPVAGWPILEMLVDGVKVKEINTLGSRHFESVTLTQKKTYTLTFRDKNNTSRNQSVNVNVLSGEVETFEIIGVKNEYVGNPFEINIIARDDTGHIAEDFVGPVTISLLSNGNPVNYSGAIEPMSAEFVSKMVDGGTLKVMVTIRYAGASMGLGDDHLQIKVSTFTPTEKSGTSAYFNMYEQQIDAVDPHMVLLLPGQVYQPGGTAIKINTANAITAGDPFGVKMYAVDRYGNRIDFDGQVTLSLTQPAAKADFGGITNLVDGYALKYVYIYTAGDQTANATIKANGSSDTSDIAVIARTYSEQRGKILLIANNGETYIPGDEAVGKTGVPDPVIAHTELIMTVLACDMFHNIDTTYSGGSMRLWSDDNAFNRTHMTFTNGIAQVSGLFLNGKAGLPTVRVTAEDENDTSRVSYSDIAVEPGAFFQITVSADEVRAGEAFSMDVKLINPETGLPGNYNHTIYMEAVEIDSTEAPPVLGIKETALVNGSVIINPQHYDHVALIKIKITDNFGRIGYSQNINVIPNGLKYIIACPDTATVDDMFDVSITLFDTVYDAYTVENMDHQVFITVIASFDDLPGAGSYGVHQTALSNGKVQFKENYTKAEHIVIQADGTIKGFTASGRSATIHITPGAYVKVQIVAPGEIPIPGVPSSTGKDSTLLEPQAAQVGFPLTVRAVDRYWNIVPSIGKDRSVKLSASDDSLRTFPTGSYIGGEIFFINVKVQLPPFVEITAEDTRNDVFSDSVRIPITGRKYKIICQPNYPLSDPQRFITGKDFTLIAYLLKYLHDGTEVVIDEPAQFYLVPLNRNMEPLDVNRIINPYYPVDAGTPNRLMTDPSSRPDKGTAFVLQYTVAEDVIFKAYDDYGWVGYSTNALTNEAVIPFEPEDVYYEIELPQEAVVGPPATFTMRIVPRDINTHTIPINFSSDVTITVNDITNQTSQYDGRLLVTGKTVTRGAVSFEQAFTRYGVVTLEIEDTEHRTTESTMKLLPASLARVEDTIPDIIEAGTTREIQFTCYDHYDNPVSNVPFALSLDDDLKNYQLGSLNAVSLQSNALGTTRVNLSVLKGFSGKLFFSAYVGTMQINESIVVAGPPTTELSFAGMSRETFKGYSLKQNDPIILTVEYNDALTLDRIMYRIDDGAWHEYDQPFFITDVGMHTIEYYSVTVGELEHPENIHRSMNVFITQATSLDEGLVNYPNPFMAGKEPTFLEYYLSQNSNVTMIIYDVFGQKVYERDITSGIMGGMAGLNRIEWDGKNNDARVIANGGYICVLDIKDENRTLKRKIAVRK